MVRGSIHFASLPVSKNASGEKQRTFSWHNANAVLVKGTTLADVSLFGFVKTILVFAPFGSRFLMR